MYQVVPGDLIHFYNPNCDPNTLENWWAERYAIASQKEVLVVAEKMGGAFGSFSRCYPRFYNKFSQITPAHRATKRITQSFLGIKIDSWVKAEFVEPPVDHANFLKNLESAQKSLRETDKWFAKVFYDRFR